MNSLTFNPVDLLRETRELAKHSSPPRDTKDWYRSATSRKNRLGAFQSWPQVVFSELRGGEQNDDDLQGSDLEGTSGIAYEKKQAEGEELESVIARAFADLPHPDVEQFRRFIESFNCAVSSSYLWTQIFAYTDFASMPIYASLLALAATATEKRLPARRVFAERCRNALRERGIAEGILNRLVDDSQIESAAERYANIAHMLACLDEPAATAGYLDAAIHFEQCGDTRSALACVYRNIRRRLRDNQFGELDDELRAFDVEAAGVDSMLAVLTATAPVKTRLSTRKCLFRRVRAELKRRGQLERGLLDDLG